MQISYSYNSIKRKKRDIRGNGGGNLGKGERVKGKERDKEKTILDGDYKGSYHLLLPHDSDVICFQFLRLVVTGLNCIFSLIIFGLAKACLQN